MLLTALAAGCTDASKFAPPCPQAAILSDGADLLRYRAASGSAPLAAHDVTDMVLSGRITGIGGSCAAGEHSTVKVTMSISMDLTRGPAANGRQAAVTYVVGVARGQTILDEQEYPTRVEFPPNTDVVHLTSQPIVMNLPVTKDLSGAAYSVFAWFKLTPEELATNRARGS